jgi:hypothetical protein
MEARINELLDLGIDRRTDEQQRELEELLALAPSTLDPYPTLVQTPYGLQDTNGVDVTLIEEQLKLSPFRRVLRLDAMARGHLRHRLASTAAR